MNISHNPLQLCHKIFNKMSSYYILINCDFIIRVMLLLICISLLTTTFGFCLIGLFFRILLQITGSPMSFKEQLLGIADIRLVLHGNALAVTQPTMSKHWNFNISAHYRGMYMLTRLQSLRECKLLPRQPLICWIWGMLARIFSDYGQVHDEQHLPIPIYRNGKSPSQDSWIIITVNLYSAFL